MQAEFYRAFEDRHRGSWADIRARLSAYQTLLTAVHGLSDNPRALDLGCGRGEWLDLLADSGFSASGVDSDPAMLAAARERGLQVEQGDALTWLSAQADGSAILISALHLVEHLPFEQVLVLIAEAHRVLAPGGLLLLETPNPENLVVGACAFYTDPTHNHPLPPALLRFVPEYFGFRQIARWGMNTSPAVVAAEDPGLLGIFGGVSPDYAILAQKAGPAALLQALAPLLQDNRGLWPEDLAQRHEHGRGRRLQAQFQSVAERIDTATSQLDQRTFALEQHIYSSYSWRLTAPLRYLRNRLRQVRQQLPTKLSAMRSASLSHLFRFIERHPRLADALRTSAGRLGLYNLLRRHYQRHRQGPSARLIAPPLTPDGQLLGDHAALLLALMDAIDSPRHRPR